LRRKKQLTRIKNIRNTTKFKRSVKAISPVIATLLMIAIAVVASLVVYAWVTGYMGNTTSKAGKAIQIQSFATSGSNLVVYVQNVGQGDVELNRDQSVYVNSNLVPITNPATTTIPITAGQTVELTLPLPVGYAQGDRLNIKVTTTDGTFMTTSGTGGSSNPTTPAATYAVNFVLGTGGLSMNPTGAQTVGGTIAITATENSGYHFTSWSSSTGSITFGDANLASTSATINGAGTVTANFAADAVQQQVTYVSAGTGAGAAGTSNNNPAPSYPTSLQAGDLILLQVVVSGISDSPTTPTGFTYLYGPDESSGTGEDGRQWIYYRSSTGSESGTLTVSVSGSVSATARMYAFRNAATTSFTEDKTFAESSNDLISAPTIDATGPRRLALSFVFDTNNIALDSFTGESGGDWAEVGEFQYDPSTYIDLTLQLQTATLATGGTITGGSYNAGFNNERWGVTAFALIPL